MQATTTPHQTENAALSGPAELDIILRIKRFDPEKNTIAYWQEFTVHVEETDKLLDAMNQVKWFQDGTLTYRRSCAHGVCGSDAMRINGRNRLACKLLIKEIATKSGTKVTIEPLLGLKVIKDLVVDMEPFFAKYREVKPYLITHDPVPSAERLQTPEQLARFEESTKCILCAACTTGCPSFWSNGQYIGPAAIVNAQRFIYDSRDQGAAERLAILNERSGVWRCRTIFNCSEACPRGIHVADTIEQVKRSLIYNEL